MRPERSAQRTVAILIGAFLAAIVASLLLGPMIFVEGCPASAGTVGSCRQYPPRTLLGHEANVWLWGSALAAIGSVSVWLIWRATPHR
jgi:hypothetical protein